MAATSSSLIESLDEVGVVDFLRLGFLKKNDKNI
jgi:hypothetical protein